MKTILNHLRIVAVAVIGLITAPVVLSQTTWMWTGANSITDTNWSDAANWTDFATGTTTGTPMPGDDVVFSSTNNPAAPFLVGNILMETNVVDAGFLSVNSSATINSLFYGFAPVNTTGFYTNGLYTNASFVTYISPGVTLTVNGTANADPGNTHNSDILFAGTGSDWGTNWSVSAQIIGSDATLLVSNAAATVNVYQGTGAGSAAYPSPSLDIQPRATLDMSALDTFIASVHHFFVGVQGSVSGGANTATTPGKQVGVMYLAKTNFITLPADGLFLIGEAASDGSQVGNTLYLGQTNVIFANNVGTGRKKGGYGNLMAFNPALTGQNPAAYFRGANGISPVTSWVIGDDYSAGSGVNPSSGTNDFTGGTVDALVDTMIVGRGQNSTSRAPGGSGTLTFNAGQIVVNNLTNGTQGNINASSSGVGTVNVNGTGALTVNNVLFLGNNLGGGGDAGTLGVLNINGGAVSVNDLVSGTSGGNVISVSGGTLSVTNLAVAGLSLNTLSLTNSAVTLPIPVSGPSVTAGTLNVGGTTNVININSIPLVSGYPATFAIVHYTGMNGVTNIGLGSLPVSSPAYTAYLTNDAGSSAINLVVLGGPAPARTLIWDGTSGGAWDIGSSLNWHTNGAGAGSTRYNDQDFVQFDDTTTSGNTSIALSTVLSPSAIVVTNNSLTYTFNNSGGGYLSGFGGITKSGSGTLIIDDNGDNNNFTGGVTVNGGTMQVGNGDGNGSLGSGSIVNNSSLVFNRNNNAAVSGAISGPGNITQEGTGGTLTLNAANTFDGAVLVTNSSILQAGNNSALGSTNGGTVVATGSALDVNGHNLGSEPVTISGAGPDSSKGAIYNSGASASPALAWVTLTGNTTVGGPTTGGSSGRWDLRSPGGTTGDPSTAGLSTGGQPYSLTKVGNNFVGIVSVTVDPALGDVDVQAGTLDFEGNTTGLGNAASNLFVRSGATFELFGATNHLNKQIQLDAGAIVYNPSGNNQIAGPINIDGSGGSGATFNGDGTSTLTLSGTLAGPGRLTKEGTNTLVLAGTDNRSGDTLINNGTFILNGMQTGTSGLYAAVPTLSAPTILGGNGTNAGMVTVDDIFEPGISGTPSTFGAGSLTMGYNANPVAIFNLGSDTTPGNGVNDLVNVAGALDGRGNTIEIHPRGPLSTTGAYTLFNCGSLSGAFNANVLMDPTFGVSRYQFSLNQTATQITLNVSGGPALLKWNNNSGNGVWDTGTSANWLNVGGGTNDVFYNLDKVWLDDSIAGASALISNSVPVSPQVITNDSTKDYTIVGNKITGGARIVKTGTGTLTIGTPNDFSGTVTISGGVLRATNSLALGATSAATIVTNAGTLDINGFSINGEPMIISGPGAGGQGAIVNTGAKQITGLQNVPVTMAGDASIGGGGSWLDGTAGRIDLRTGSLSTGGNGYNLTKVGTNEFGIVDTTVDPMLGNIDINAGAFHVEGTTTSLGNPAATLTAEPGGALAIYAATNELNKQFVFIGDGVKASLTNENGSDVLIGPVTLSNSVVIGVGGSSLTNRGIISGTGSLTKVGGSPLVLTTNETYTGDTTISRGSLSLAENGALGGSPNIIVRSGATVDVSARIDSTLTLVSGQTLAGRGTVNGSLASPANSTVAPGTNGVTGVLTVTTNANLAGSTVMKLDAGNSTNDVLAVSADLVYGGMLTLTNNLSGTLAAGQTYKLFSAATYSGAFSSINPPAPGANLAWDTNNLTLNGAVSIVSTVASSPQITGISLSGTMLTLTATNGSNGGQFVLLESTNVALPLAQWTPVLTNNFDGSGNLNLSTNVINPANAQTFYILKQ